MAPKPPALAPTTATGLLRRTLVASGREAQNDRCPALDD